MARPRRQSTFQGQRLRSARLELGLSQADLAQRLQVHRATLIRWESNLSAPTPEQEEQLSSVLSRGRSWFQQTLPEPPPRPSVELGLSTDEKLEILLSRVGRIEKRLEHLTELMSQWLAAR
ncbi:helix-turn-helix domain-containing protein [bacterium]|nr:helix-turn-helix domain-containing protein [bacterium]